MEAYHLCEPSPQRTPVLFQAGASSKGRQFAAQHAECVFISGRNPGITAGIVEDLRERAKALQRDPASITIYTTPTVITGTTDAEAQAKLAHYRKHVNVEGALTLLSGYLGVDLAGSDLDEPLKSQETNAIQSCLDGFNRFDPTRNWTLRDAAETLRCRRIQAGVDGFPEDGRGWTYRLG
jgi:long-chain alkane monooxygenase